MRAYLLRVGFASVLCCLCLHVTWSSDSAALETDENFYVLWASPIDELPLPWWRSMQFSERFAIYGDFSYGSLGILEGGHSHTLPELEFVSSAMSTPAFVARDDPSYQDAAPSFHTHTVFAYGATAKHETMLPPHVRLAFVYAPSLDMVIPGMIAMWAESRASIPSGWRECDGLEGRPDLRGRFVRGIAYSDESPGTIVEGTLLHHHLYDLNVGTSHALEPDVPLYSLGQYQALAQGFHNHRHYAADVPTAVADADLPPFYELLFIRYEGAAPVDPPPGLIVMHSTGYGSGDPNGWKRCDGTEDTPDLSDRLIRGAPAEREAGSSGGGAGHTHVAQAELIELGLGSTLPYRDATSDVGSSFSPKYHEHEVTVPARVSSTQSSMPPSAWVRFLMREGAVTAATPSEIDRKFAVYSAIPNPFNPSTTIAWSLPAASDATLEVFDSRGRRVVTLVDGWVDAGDGSIVWYGRDSTGTTVSSGVYFYRLTAGDFEDTKRMVLIK